MKKLNINIYQVFIFLLIMSFSYERPIFIISAFDKLNPRLFDLCLILGLIITFKNNIILRDEVFLKWSYLVGWFVFCVSAGLVLFDFDVNVRFFMIFYLLEYLKGLLVLVIFLKIPNDKLNFNNIFIPLLCGGFFVSLYCVFELFIGVEEIILNDSVIQYKSKEIVWGPFTGSYFNIAVYIPLITSLIYSKLLHSANNNVKWFLLFVFCSWPVFFCGSRTAIFLWLFSNIIITLFYINKAKTIFVILFVAILSFFIFIQSDFGEENYTIERLKSFEEAAAVHEHNSIKNRLLYAVNLNIPEYDEHNLLPVIGGGFYVAPKNGVPRIGYGFHNIYVFAFEQGGFIALWLFLLFLIVFLKKTYKYLKWSQADPIRWFVIAVYCYLIASLLIGWSGHTFWRGFATSNFNTLRLLLLVFVSLHITNIKQSKSEIL